MGCKERGRKFKMSRPGVSQCQVEAEAHSRITGLGAARPALLIVHYSVQRLDVLLDRSLVKGVRLILRISD